MSDKFAIKLNFVKFAQKYCIIEERSMSLNANLILYTM